MGVDGDRSPGLKRPGTQNLAGIQSVLNLLVRGFSGEGLQIQNTESKVLKHLYQGSMKLLVGRDYLYASRPLSPIFCHSLSDRLGKVCDSRFLQQHINFRFKVDAAWQLPNHDETCPEVLPA